MPGWHGAGAVDVTRLNLARWLNRDDRPSDITGHVTFDLALQLGRHFPRGMYGFQGPHAMYMNYAADNVRARGRLTDGDVLIAEASASAYGAAVTTTDATIGIDRPFPFHFQGRTTGIDLRNVPRDRSRAARREPADVRLRRHRPVRRSVHCRARDVRALGIPRRGRRRRHRRVDRHAAEADALLRRWRDRAGSISAASDRDSTSTGCSSRGMRERSPDISTSMAAARQSPSLTLNGGGHLVDGRSLQGHTLGRRRLDRDCRRHAARIVQRTIQCASIPPYRFSIRASNHP